MFYRKIDTVKLENAVLKDPTIRSYGTAKMKRSCTVGTSGKFICQGAIKGASQSSLLPSIKIIKSQDITTFYDESTPKCLGEGRFGTCSLKLFSHFTVCMKEFKLPNNNAFIKEANILSHFHHSNLPYLFGVCVGDNPALIISFHGFDNECVTLHDAVLSKLQVTKELLNDSSNWINILKQITTGLNYMHTKYKVIHNDIKSDNICLAPSFTTTMSVKAVIIDFGKACNITNGKSYKLSDSQKKQYKNDHPHIAPDLRDGTCTQSTLSDVFALGRVIKLVNSVPQLQKEDLEMLSTKCMHYHMHSRPEMCTIIQCLN